MRISFFTSITSIEEYIKFYVSCQDNRRSSVENRISLLNHLPLRLEGIIGTTSPGSTLHLSSATAWNPIVTIENTNGDISAPQIFLTKNGGSPANDDYVAGILGAGKNSNNASINYTRILSTSAVVTAGSERGRLFLGTAVNNGVINDALVIYNGNVGIGQATPVHKIDVVGTAGLSTGTAWTNTSDIRFKNIQSELAGSALEKVMALRPVSFTWSELHDTKYGKDPGLKYGFIAQDVQKVIPEFISQDKEDFLWYNPSGMEAILTAAIQEQQKEIEQLRKEVAELKRRLDLVLPVRKKEE